MNKESKLNSVLSQLIEQSYHSCARIAASSGSSFYWAFSLLKPERRKSITALYAVARLADDWSDDETSAKFPRERWDMMLDWCASSEDEPPLDHDFEQSFLGLHWALRDSVRRYSIPIDQLKRLIDGVSSDRARRVRISDFAALDEYCDQVASSVGLCCLAIWGGDSAKNMDAALACGRAFQYTNVIRDVREDLQRDRIYLPQMLLDQFRVTEDSLQSSTTDENVLKMIDHFIGRAKLLYDRSWSLAETLPLDGQRMFSLIWCTYSSLLSKLANNQSLLLHRRVSLRIDEKLALYLRHAWTPTHFAAVASLNRKLKEVRVRGET